MPPITRPAREPRAKTEKGLVNACLKTVPRPRQGRCRPSKLRKPHWRWARAWQGWLAARGLFLPRPRQRLRHTFRAQLCDGPHQRRPHQARQRLCALGGFDQAPGRRLSRSCRLAFSRSCYPCHRFRAAAAISGRRRPFRDRIRLSDRLHPAFAPQSKARRLDLRRRCQAGSRKPGRPADQGLRAHFNGPRGRAVRHFALAAHEVLFGCRRHGPHASQRRARYLFALRAYRPSGTLERAALPHVSRRLAFRPGALGGRHPEDRPELYRKRSHRGFPGRILSLHPCPSRKLGHPLPVFLALHPDGCA